MRGRIGRDGVHGTNPMLPMKCDVAKEETKSSMQTPLFPHFISGGLPASANALTDYSRNFAWPWEGGLDDSYKVKYDYKNPVTKSVRKCLRAKFGKLEMSSCKFFSCKF